VEAVEDVLSPGDELDVTVVEVDRERGRIGLRLSSDPAVEGKEASELATIGTGDPGPRRRDGGGGRDRGRGGRDRSRGGRDGGRGNGGGRRRRRFED
jgi:polyribonucleotide nucleotidyltransferase